MSYAVTYFKPNWYLSLH